MRSAFLFLRHRRRSLLDGGDDVRVGGAAADVAAHVFTYVVIIGGVAFLDAGDRGDDLARRAVPALEGVLIDKGLLHWMQLVALRQSLDGDDRLVLSRQCQRPARQDASIAYPDRAGAALAVVTAFLTAG